ncbi:DUF58 domain-containing protein [Achromobacter marplatensis]|jgi:uncharacterized protein (DUF58 family)|uniref:DUF58 domain-containing protein n=1 Tax=Achromobacter marplatensis TaxID=470868 RepID=A0AA42W9F0_9BURK|nr:DUF58 domain-containing protein [Achromobacter marplatensis]EJO29811.1 hypothetical protein QWC_19375 [Achromobacter marplatensis]MDH2050236.1 DUF58 domain-containing protein [Achromobacter marplatensis]
MNRTPHPVHPPLSELIALEAAVSGLSFLATQPLSSVLAGPHGSRLRGRGLDFAELRRYVAGDDLRRLDLRASLRYGKPFVRSYTEERDRPAMIVVDQRMSMYFGSVRAFKCAVAARLAAIAAWIAYRGGDRVGGLVFDDAGVRAFKPLRSRDRVRALLAEVARANANLSAAQPDLPASQGLNRALRGALLNAPHDCLVCVISDFAGADEETLRTLRLLAAHNDVLAMLVFDPMAQQLPRSGRLVVTQGELQLEVAVGRQREREPLARFFSDRLRQVAELLRRSRVPLLSIDTEQEELPQLRRELGKQVTASATPQPQGARG